MCSTRAGSPLPWGAGAVGEPTHRLEDLYPVGIYTIPEISYVGRTEREHREPDEVGEIHERPGLRRGPANRSL
jgi:pyruvate/2-oxoglutarate dehydrogenase complex dihydrolipoamide dehydrogenase (E3) component